MGPALQALGLLLVIAAGVPLWGVMLNAGILAVGLVLLAKTYPARVERRRLSHQQAEVGRGDQAMQVAAERCRPLSDLIEEAERQAEREHMRESPECECGVCVESRRREDERKDCRNCERVTIYSFAGRESRSVVTRPCWVHCDRCTFEPFNLGIPGADFTGARVLVTACPAHPRKAL